MTVFAPSLASVWRQIADAGVDPQPLFDRYDVDPAVIFDPQARVSGARIDRIVAEAVKLTGDPFFGLREAEYFMPAHLGPFGFAWLASATLRDAFHRLQRYARVLNDKLEVSVIDGGNSLRIRVHDAGTSLNAYHRDLAALSLLVRMCRFICGEEWQPQKVFVAHPEPADTSYFYRYFRCPVEFDAPDNGLGVDAVDADQRLTGANEHLAQLNDHIVTRYLAHRSRTDVVNRVRAVILDTLADGRASEQLVARRLHLSPRQLNRKLKQRQTSFRDLLVDCRRELAEQYINDSTLSLTEISYLLGFSEASSFSRAYRRWTGNSPTEARAARTSGGEEGGSGPVSVR